MIQKKLLTVMISIVSLLSFMRAFAYDWTVTGRVTLVEGTYMPTQVTFQMDVGGGSCPAGSFLTWNGNGQAPDNVKAVYAGLLTALNTSRQINFYGRNTGCVGDFIHFK